MLNINGTDVASTAGDTRTGSYNLFLFCHNLQGNYTVAPAGQGNTRIYSFIKKNNSTGVKSQEFIPCYRRADNVAGFYDMVNSTFITNSGTGTFTIGPAV